MKQQLSILLLEDNVQDAIFIEELLRSEGYDLDLKRFDSERPFRTALQTCNPDIIISDYSLPGYSGKAALAAAQELHPDIPFIFYSGTIGEERAIDALKEGATDYVLKDNPKRLISAVERALQDSQKRIRQKKADEQILEQAQLLDLANDAIIVRDLDDTIRYFNQGAERLFGYSSSEVLARKTTDILPQSILNRFLEIKKMTLEEGHWEGELEHFTKENRPLVVNARWTLVRNPQTGSERILSINTDITEKKQIEQQFLRAQRLESIGTLASGIAHDLNNILAPILMASEILREDQQDPQNIKMLETIQESAQRGADIVKQVLTFVRGTDGKRISILLPYLLNDIYKVASETFPKNITVKSSVAGNLWPVLGDSTQLHQVLMNLCVNARDAMPQGGKLTLTAKNIEIERGPSVLIQVEDSGTGIPPDILDKIFDPFFTTKEMGKGTGLGLSTVAGIVKSHGGTVKVASKEGQGTTFAIVLPAERGTTDLKIEGRKLPVPNGRGELILLVDDEPQIRKTISHALTLHGYEVLTADDGNSAMIQFATHKNEIKAVITDLMMPGMDGSSLVRTISILKPEIKLIVTSGLPEATAVPASTLVLQKPVSMEVLFRALNKLLQNG